MTEYEQLKKAYERLNLWVCDDHENTRRQQKCGTMGFNQTAQYLCPTLGTGHDWLAYEFKFYKQSLARWIIQIKFFSITEGIIQRQIGSPGVDPEVNDWMLRAHLFTDDFSFDPRFRAKRFGNRICELQFLHKNPEPSVGCWRPRECHYDCPNTPTSSGNQDHENWRVPDAPHNDMGPWYDCWKSDIKTKIVIKRIGYNEENVQGYQNLREFFWSSRNAKTGKYEWFMQPSQPIKPVTPVTPVEPVKPEDSKKPDMDNSSWKDIFNKSDMVTQKEFKRQLDLAEEAIKKHDDMLTKQVTDQCLDIVERCKKIKSDTSDILNKLTNNPDRKALEEQVTKLLHNQDDLMRKIQAMDSERIQAIKRETEEIIDLLRNKDNITLDDLQREFKKMNTKIEDESKKATQETINNIKAETNKILEDTKILKSTVGKIWDKVKQIVTG